MILSTQIHHTATIEISTQNHSFVEVECSIIENQKETFPFQVVSFKLTISNHSYIRHVTIPTSGDSLLDALASFEKHNSKLIDEILTEIKI